MIDTAMNLQDDRFIDRRTLCAHRFEPTSSGPARTCGSPALRDQKFCYYHHHPTRKPIPSPKSGQDARRARRIARQSFALTPPTSRAALQRSLGEVIQRVAANQLDLRRAELILNGLKLAGQNLSPE
jgi:hypothetical protein